MSDLLIAFLFALGASGWIYGKMHRKTGGNTQNTLIVAGVSGLAILIVVWGILAMIF